MRSIKNIRLLVVLFCALGIAMAASAGRVGIKPQPKKGSAGGPAPSELIGKAAPDFTLGLVSGGEATLSEHRGKYVLVDFWGTWCGPCVAGIPELKEVYSEIDKDKFEFVSICVNCSNLETFVTKREMDWVQLVGNDSVTDDYSVRAFPTLFVIDPEGKVVTDSFANNGLRGDLLATLEDLSKNKPNQ